MGKLGTFQDAQQSTPFQRRGSQNPPNNQIFNQRQIGTMASRGDKVVPNNGGDLTKKMRKMEKQLKTLQKEKENMENQHKKELRDVAKSSGKKKRPPGLLTVPISTEMEELVKKETGVNLWRTCKFLSSQEQILKASGIVMNGIPAASSLFPDHVDDEDLKIRSFKATHGSVITSEINTKCTNAQSALRNEHIKRHKKGLKMPSVRELQNVIRRKGLEEGDGKPEDIALNRDWFMWHWDKLLPKVAGKTNWAQSKRHCGTISSAVHPDDPTKKCITTTDEALVALLCENCGQRFPYVARCKNSNPPVEEDKTCEKYQSKFSTTQAGQDDMGGWNAAGRLRFVKLTEAIRSSKGKEHVAGVEETCLHDLQVRYKLVSDEPPKKPGAKGPKDFETNEDCHLDFGQESDAENPPVDAESDLDEAVEEYQAYKPPKNKKARLNGDDDDA